MTPVRSIVAAALLAALAACGGEPASRALPALPPLEALEVGAPATHAGRAWDGVVEAVQRADLGAQTAGRVTEVNADIGDQVDAGSVLLRLTAVEQQAGADTARAQLRAAQAAAVEAEATYARFEALAERQHVSRLQLDQARATRDSAVAAVAAARAQLAQATQQAGYTVVRAPFEGIVSARHVEPGEALAPGQPLLSLYAPDALRIEVQVPQSDAAAIRATPRATVLLADGRRVEAARVLVHPAADPQVHSVGVRVSLPALEQPPAPGVTAKVLFPMAAGADASGVATIPASAVVQRGELSAVYVLDAATLRLRQLRLGRRANGEVEVLAGLRQGETIAADPVAAAQALVAQRQAAGADGG